VRVVTDLEPRRALAGGVEVRPVRVASLGARVRLDPRAGPSPHDTPAGTALEADVVDDHRITRSASGASAPS